MRSPVKYFFTFMLLVLGVAAVNIFAATLTVTKTDDTNDGVCDADCSLREAVAVAASGDTIVFSSLFSSPQTITLTGGQITIDKNLTITGTGQDLVTISGNNASRIFLIYQASNALIVNLSGMTLRDGNPGSPAPNGGAIAVINSMLNVSNATFTNNIASDPQCSCGNSGAIFGDENSSLTLSNLIVTGNSSDVGVAIGANSIDIRDSMVKQNPSGGVGASMTLNVERCVISDNSGRGANAEYLTVIDSTIMNNTDGGLLGGDSFSTTAIERCLISGNSRDVGAAGVLLSGMTIIKDTQITNNRATAGGGGGIYNFGTLYLINSTVSGNTSSFSGFNIDGGGGILTYGGSLFVINSTVSGNTAGGSPGAGGGIYISADANDPNGRVYLVNSTVANNTSVGGGGGVRVDANGHGTFSNTIVAGNNSTGTTQEDVSGIVTSNGINLIGNTAGSSGWIANDLLNVNPMLGPLADNGGSTMTHALLPGSPAINAGNNSVAIDPQTQMPLTVDQRGFLRFSGGTVDIGAYEVQPLIAGTVTYGNAIGAPTPRFVSGVLLSAAGSANVTATTSTAGTYTLGGFGSGAYTVTPSKVGDANGISSFDSGKVAQKVAGLQTLTANQLIVADVSGNGTISSFDAALIARYAAGLNNSGSTGNWIFMPVNRTYASVTSNLAGQDFIALLMGDVSGNWMDGGSRR